MDQYTNCFWGYIYTWSLSLNQYLQPKSLLQTFCVLKQGHSRHWFLAGQCVCQSQIGQVPSQTSCNTEQIIYRMIINRTKSGTVISETKSDSLYKPFVCLWFTGMEDDVSPQQTGKDHQWSSQAQSSPPGVSFVCDAMKKIKFDPISSHFRWKYRCRHFW